MTTCFTPNNIRSVRFWYSKVNHHDLMMEHIFPVKNQVSVCRMYATARWQIHNQIHSHSWHCTSYMRLPFRLSSAVLLFPSQFLKHCPFITYESSLAFTASIWLVRVCFVIQFFAILSMWPSQLMMYLTSSTNYDFFFHSCFSVQISCVCFLIPIINQFNHTSGNLQVTLLFCSDPRLVTSIPSPFFFSVC